jgi:GNAT superfamily N-acetyltransferase
MEIRKANIQDCIQLTNIRIEMRKERETESLNVSSEIFYDNTLNYFKENILKGNFVAFVAVDKGEIIATSGICFYSVPPTYGNPDGKVGYIVNMYTKAPYRKKGIARQLLDCIVNEAKIRSCNKITLNASDMGKSIYEKYGFKDLQNEMVYYCEQ